MTGHRKRAAQAANPPVLLAGYVGPNFWKNNRRKLMALLAFIASIYGATFGLFTTYIVMQLLAPIVIIVLLCIWLLPVSERAPYRLMERLLLVFVAAVINWPNYLAIALPGMPWITVIRLVAVPLAISMMLSLSLSRKFRKDMKEAIDAVPAVWKMMTAFMIIAFLSIFVSKNVGNSVNKFIVAQLYWTLIFFAAAYSFTKPDRATQFTWTIWISTIIVCLIGQDEWRRQAVFYAGHIPSFLKVDDELLASLMSSKARAATGIYRVKSVFSTPLGLAEFLALAMPFVLHTAVISRNYLIRFAALGTIPLVFLTITKTDSRLGVVGFFLSLLMYLLAWGAMRWRDHPERVLGRLVVCTYPVVAAAFFALSLVWRRLHVMMWGAGATNASTEARRQQVASGIPKILQHPWGHGIGEGAETLGHYGGSGSLTIDTYYLLVGLEYGILGYILYFGMFLVAVYFGCLALLQSKPGEVRLLVPLMISVMNFSIIKSIFSQESNHPLVFCMLGMIVALVYRISGTARGQPAVERGTNIEKISRARSAAEILKGPIDRLG
jgi:hypothetical protein